MARFVYVARNAATGRKVRGALEAESAKDVVARLADAGYVAVSVRSERAWRDADVRKLIGLGATPVSTRDRALFFRQMATMLKAGLPLGSALQAATEQGSGRVREVARGLIAEIEAGKPLNEAMRRFPEAFRPLHAELVRSGEMSGALDEVLDRLARDEERRMKTEGRVRSAAAYPAVVLLATIGMLVFMTYSIVPTFVGIFQQVQVPLPWTTRMLVTISQRPAYGVLALAALASPVLAALIATRFPKGRRMLDTLKLRAPLFGHLVAILALARTTRGLATMIRSGFPMLDALEAASGLAGNEVFAEALREVRRGVERGSSLADSLRFAGGFPAFLIEMVSVGERTGALDELLDRSASMYEEEADQRMSGLTSLMEPALMLVMGGFIGFIAFSVFMPMFSLINNFSQMGGG